MHTAAIPLVLATAAAVAAEQPFPIPKPDAVSRVVVVTGIGAKEDKVVIKDAKQIERLLGFLKVRNDGWEKPRYTFPVPYRTITLEKDKDLVLVLWQGPNWLGGREGGGGADDNRLRPLSKKDLAELLDILGLAKR